MKNENTGPQNEAWAKKIIDALLLQGIDYFCLSPGSRTSSLALAIAENRSIDSFVHLDERGLAFHALGYAKASQKPAVIIATSGTAVGNLMPAIMEAFHAHIPLIIITADRPPELRDNGANQTIDQVKLFQSYVRWQFDLPCPTSCIPENFVATILSYAVYKSKNSPSGPVHINCMFREPLFGELKFENQECNSFKTDYELSYKTASLSSLETWASKLSSVEKGILIVGSLQTKRSLEPIYEVSEKLGWPILPDITSPLRNQGERKQVATHFDSILKIFPETQIDAVLHLGDRFVSKTLLEWLAKNPLKFYGLIADHSYLYDPKHMVTNRLDSDPVLFCEQILPFLPLNEERKWHSLFSHGKEIGKTLDHLFAKEKELSEPGLIHLIQQKIPPSFSIFLSNSMPVRDADSFFFPQCKSGPIFSNRGVSGIDGNIATAIGIAKGLKKPTVAILGDLATLHDINSLAQLRSLEIPIIFLILNNKGGGIFSFLPISKKTEHFEKFFAAAHPFTFEHAAGLFKIPYYRPKATQELEEIFSKEFTSPQSCIVEVETDRTQNQVMHEKITQFLKTTLLCSPTLSLVV